MITKIFAAIGAIAVVMFLWGVLVNATTPHSTLDYSPSRFQPTTHQVIYRVNVSDCMNFSVTYSLPSGTAQKDVSVCPGKDVIDRFSAQTGEFVYLSAQNTTELYTQKPFSCEILIDNKSVTKTQSIGFAKIASCNGSLP